ncbi:MAG: AmmeMemoRadiSam system protein B [Candidatus Omnitrophica bacterium]|nr:AmmeMemoRadiSam system protein B [Candidatus Omnitrophota bacterium]
MRRMKPLGSWPKPPERNKRQPVVAGIFYPEEKRPLTDLIDRVTVPARRPALADAPPRAPARSARRRRAMAAIVPHGGLLDSGEVAGQVYSRIDLPPTVVLLGPNHTGAGRPFSVMARGSWVTPLGELPIDEELAEAILAGAPELEKDSLAHQDEHSIEVQLPFLQRLGRIKAFVPIALAEAEEGTEMAVIRRIGQALAQAIRRREGEVLLVASTDLSRHEPLAAAQRKDRLALDRILALDEAGLMEAVKEHEISMCGPASVSALIAAAKSLGVAGALLVKYEARAGQAGESDSVIGYGGILLR